jgi:hypothetical protein
MTKGRARLNPTALPTTWPRDRAYFCSACCARRPSGHVRSVRVLYDERGVRIRVVLASLDHAAHRFLSA